MRNVKENFFKQNYLKFRIFLFSLNLTVYDCEAPS